MSKNIYSFWNEEKGATAIEYSLIAALLAIAAIGALQAVATSLSTNFSDIASGVDSAV
ncbi:Flp family type IVb pilin [Parvularcula sp. IMCC14364]|uniref:Flp family type IVb pilin n=1 Tax=Parvularcula sp. IMCC14364 TaxID=3067902 RepID=UPI0027417175|nr:Flp family type IVb pilin [Parvularcula sp. IMCC14364]